MDEEKVKETLQSIEKILLTCNYGSATIDVDKVKNTIIRQV